MSVLYARSLSAVALTLFASLSVAHAASDDMSHALKHDMSHEMSMTQPAASDIYHGQGVVKKVTQHTISIAHQPIPALNWPAMTMTFSLPAEGTLPVVNVGEEIAFSFSQQADGYQLASVTPTK